MTHPARLVPDAMRSVVLIVLLATVPAYADTPRPAPKPTVLPRASLADVMPKPEEPSGNAHRGPAFGGGTAAGIVIKPPPHPDAQPWPKGMVITPPDVNDPIAIAPGGDGLSPGQPLGPDTWSKLFADVIQGGIDAIFELMLPPSL